MLSSMKRFLSIGILAMVAIGIFASFHAVHAYSAFPDPLNNADVPILVNRIATAFLGIIGALFFVMFLWGGFQYMTAGGDVGKVKHARTTLVNSVIGIALVAFSYVLAGWVLAWIWIGGIGVQSFDEPEMQAASTSTKTPSADPFGSPN